MMKRTFRDTRIGLQGDHVIIKKLHTPPLPTAKELKAIFDSLPDYHPYKIAFGLIAIQGMRPAEVVDLTWNNFIYNKRRTRIVQIKHNVYKPQSRITHSGTRCFYKEVKKPFFSLWLSNQILGYASQYPSYPYKRVFPFTKPDSLRKYFNLIRKKLNVEYPFLLDTCSFVLFGQGNKQYRINPYSLRRFAFTYHYYTTFARDSINLSRSFGHSTVSTTLDYYVFAKETIGLTDEDIKANIGIDKFIGFTSKKDKHLYEYFPHLNPEEGKLLSFPGQRKITDYK